MKKNKHYGRKFYSDLVGTSGPSAERIVPMVMDLIPVESVLDVGCGVGAWLLVFQNNGVKDIMGIDGNWVEGDQILIPRERFTVRELGQNFDLNRRFDLAVCLEVAEHLKPVSAPKLIAELCQLAPVVLFSAAIPNQGGIGHVNEQWPSYWAKLFADQNYKFIDALRLKTWEDDEVAWWYSQNMVIYANKHALSNNPKLAAAQMDSNTFPLPLVHPEMYCNALRRSKTPLRIQISRNVRRRIQKWFGKL